MGQSQQVNENKLPLGRVHISTEAERQYREAGEPVGPGIWHEGFKRGFTYALSLRDAEQPEGAVLDAIRSAVNSPRREGEHHDDRDQRILQTIEGLVDGSISPALERFRQSAEQAEGPLRRQIEELLSMEWLHDETGDPVDVAVMGILRQIRDILDNKTDGPYRRFGNEYTGQ